ncbi:HAD-like domain-containing protein [Chlamydoabsidia padenii]|nr:HAD-like domain-containing protein [Chlamydoabsidia padenii]
MPKSIKSLVFVDFDETITLKDTIGLLGQVGVDAHNSRIPWSYFVQSYLDDYHHVKQTLPQPGNTVKQQVDYLDGFRHVEQASLARVSDSGILGGLDRQQWQQAGATKVQLQPSVKSTLMNQVEPDRLYIVSLNWCKDWIRGALGGYGLKDDHLLCNDLEYDPATHLSTGLIRPSILNTCDKARHIQSVLEQYNTTRSIYIGDSMGDLLPLVQCDVGIIIGKNKKLLEGLQQVGITVQEGLSPTTSPDLVYRVDDWDTIAQSGILT